MKKLKIIGIIVLSIFIVIQIAKFMFRTPVFSGQVLDATTEKPIENAIVTAIWWKSKIEGTGPCYSVTVITGKDGKYTIPKYTRIHGDNLYMFDPYFRMSLGVVHPLYEGIPPVMNMVWQEAGWSNNNKIEFQGEKKDGIIHYDMRLMGLLSAYGGEVKSEKLSVISKEMSEEEKKKRTEMGLSFESYLRTHEDGWYWLTLKEKNVPFDLEETFNIWEKIASNFDKYSDSNYRTRDVKETEEKIKKRLEVGGK